ncbi:MAG: response regulator [Chloroflexi bacterium]|nr:response regulator [Chloroflexota bacterium]
MTNALVIDDNRGTADALVQMLEVLGLSARAAYGASPAMSILSNTIPDLVLLDVNMPGVDGLEILAYLRREPRLVSVPVVVITSDDQPETRQRVMKGGAQGMIIKPASLEQLEDALKQASVL